jgi:hypothetical protein
MTVINWSSLGYGALTLLAAPAAALAQIPTPPPTAPAAPADGTGAALVYVVAALIGLLLIVGIAVKFYDAKRKREEEGVALQARLSDPLLLHPRLAGLPVVASVHMPLWRGSPPVVELKGTVPDPDAREIAVEVVRRELAGMSVRFEDQISVDPLSFKRVAA